MPPKQDVSKANDVFDLQQNYIIGQLKRQNEFIEELRRKRRRTIITKSSALFFGLVLMLYGIIELVFLRSFETSIGNIIMFGVVEVVAIPLFFRGVVLFRGMAFDADLSHAAEKLVDLQDDLVHLREEHARQEDLSAVSSGTRTEDLQDEEEPTPLQASPVRGSSPACPECGKDIQEGARICRNCGHLFV